MQFVIVHEHLTHNKASCLTMSSLCWDAWVEAVQEKATCILCPLVSLEVPYVMQTFMAVGGTWCVRDGLAAAKVIDALGMGSPARCLVQTPEGPLQGQFWSNDESQLQNCRMDYRMARRPGDGYLKSGIPHAVEIPVQRRCSGLSAVPTMISLPRILQQCTCSCEGYHSFASSYLHRSACFLGIGSRSKVQFTLKWITPRSCPSYDRLEGPDCLTCPSE